MVKERQEHFKPLCLCFVSTSMAKYCQGRKSQGEGVAERSLKVFGRPPSHPPQRCGLPSLPPSLPPLASIYGQGHVFPPKGVISADASLSLALQRALRVTMVATSPSTIIPRERAYELSGEE
jgi:hypothetical protein